jgi:uncharacterized protein YaeQ
VALKSTVFKAALSIADIDHGYYADHALTLARHPSETDERMMIRVCALALNAHKLESVCNGDATLSFGAGLSDVDEPDVWLKDFTGRTRAWIEVGQPDEKPLLKACGRADEVMLYAYSHAADIWWKGVASKLARARNLRVYKIESETARQVAAIAARSMNLQATIQDGALSISDEANTVTVEPMVLQAA